MSSDTVEDDFVRSARKMVDSASKKVLSNLKKEKLIQNNLRYSLFAKAGL